MKLMIKQIEEMKSVMSEEEWLEFKKSGKQGGVFISFDEGDSFHYVDEHDFEPKFVDEKEDCR